MMWLLVVLLVAVVVLQIGIWASLKSDIRELDKGLAHVIQRITRV